MTGLNHNETPIAYCLKQGEGPLNINDANQYTEKLGKALQGYTNKTISYSLSKPKNPLNPNLSKYADHFFEAFNKIGDKEIQPYQMPEFDPLTRTGESLEKNNQYRYRVK